MEVEELLRTGLRRATDAGVLGVKSHHLTETELEELLGHSARFLWRQRTEPSPIADGWYFSAGGIRPWWDREATLNEREALSIRPLRTQVYDLLEERGWIVKGMGNNVPIHVAPPQALDTDATTTAVITLTPRGAGFGDPETNARVEAAGIRTVTDTYRAQGWVVEDVSKQNLGWDLTATRGDEVRHLEVKGVSGSLPTVLLTRNEFNTAQRDPGWRLAVVTSALTAPTLAQYGPEQVAGCAAPQLYRVQLPPA